MLTSQASGTLWLRSDVLCFPQNEISLPRAVLSLSGGLGSSISGRVAVTVLQEVQVTALGPELQ